METHNKPQTHTQTNVNLENLKFRKFKFSWKNIMFQVQVNDNAE